MVKGIMGVGLVRGAGSTLYEMVAVECVEYTYVDRRGSQLYVPNGPHETTCAASNTPSLHRLDLLFSLD